MSPVDHATAIVPLVAPAKDDAVSLLERDPLGKVDVVAHQEGVVFVSVGLVEGDQKLLVPGAVQIVPQLLDHPTVCFDPDLRLSVLVRIEDPFATGLELSVTGCLGVSGCDVRLGLAGDDRPG